MAIAFVNAATTVGTSSTSITANMPTSIVSGNVLLAFVYEADGPSPTITTPTGWTRAADSAGTSDLMAVFWKAATGSEGATQVFASNKGFLSVSIHQYSGVSTSTPMDVTPVFSIATSSTATTTSATAVGTTDMLVLAYGSFNGDTFTTPTGVTSPTGGHANSSSVSSIFTFWKLLSASGATGTFSSTQSASDPYTTGTVLLKAGTTSTLTNTVAPAVTPSPGVVWGTVLSTDDGTWSATPDSFTYQWKSNGATIVGETNNSYTTLSGDVGATITCAVTAAKAGFTGATATSNGVSVSNPGYQVRATNWAARMNASNW